MAAEPGGPSLGNMSETARPTGETGWIKRNAMPDRVDAPYTLVDKQGKVRCFLESSDGADLERFVNHEVSVRGRSADSGKYRVLTVDQVSPPASTSSRAPQDDRGSGSRGAGVRQVAYQDSPSRATPEELPSTPEGVPGAAPRSRSVMSGPVRTAPPGQTAPAQGPADATYDDGAGPYGDFLGDGDCYDDYCDDGLCANFCGPPGRYWVRTEYLYWWTQGMNVPPLVTTGPSVQQPGYLGEPGTVILFGNGQVNNGGFSGGRVTAGMWLNPCNTVGIQGDYFGLGSASTDYSATSGGTPILSRPFFDTRPSLAAQNVEQVASPGSIAGTVSVHIPTQFQGAGVGMLFNLCCSSCCDSCCDSCSCCPFFDGPSSWRLDFLLGYRWAQLNDQVNINENLVSLNTELPGSFLVNDRFTSQNRFNGVELGIIAQSYHGRWSLEGVMKMALGVTNEFVTINGSTTTTQNGTTTTDVGGLLALSSNIGNYRRNEFAMLPQLGANVGYLLMPHVRVLFGYSFLYWSRVARAGDQIDTDVNSTLLPNSPNPPTGDLRHPQFTWHANDFWAQGINVGLEFRW